MEFEEIEVIIGKDGKVQIHVHGVNGTQCLELTEELEKALGGEVLSRIMSPEAYQQGNPADIDPDQQLKASG